MSDPFSLISVDFWNSGHDEVGVGDGLDFVDVVIVHPLVHDRVQRVQELDDLHGAAGLGHDAEVNNRAGNRFELNDILHLFLI